MDTIITKWIPVPYFQINQESTILNSSNTTHSYFPAWNYHSSRRPV